jgi:hypothetical protein
VCANPETGDRSFESVIAELRQGAYAWDASTQEAALAMLTTLRTLARESRTPARRLSPRSPRPRPELRLRSRV